MAQTQLTNDKSDFWEGFLEREGETPAGVGWPNQENQRIRFAQLTRLFDPDSDGFTVNDLGCGFGDLYAFIRDQGLAMQGYRGYDVSEKMLDVARKRVGPDAELVRAERLTERADYSFGCGIFNTQLKPDEDEWLAYMKSVILDLNEHSERGFAFNSLTTYVEYREDPLFYADPMEMFRFCKGEISSRVEEITGTSIARVVVRLESASITREKRVG